MNPPGLIQPIKKTKVTLAVTLFTPCKVGGYDLVKIRPFPIVQMNTTTLAYKQEKGGGVFVKKHGGEWGKGCSKPFAKHCYKSQECSSELVKGCKLELPS